MTGERPQDALLLLVAVSRRQEGPCPALALLALSQSCGLLASRVLVVPVEREKPLAGRQEVVQPVAQQCWHLARPWALLPSSPHVHRRAGMRARAFQLSSVRSQGHLGDDQEPLLEGSGAGAAVSPVGICPLPTSEPGRRGICECFLVTSYRSRLSWPQSGDLY